MTEEEKLYMVWEDDGDEHGYTRLHQFGTNSMIEAVAFQHQRSAHGIMRWENGEYVELSPDAARVIFMQELQGLMTNGKHLEIQRLLGDSFAPPPPEFLEFMRQNFAPTPLFQIRNPYEPGITISGVTDNLVLASIKKATSP